MNTILRKTLALGTTLAMFLMAAPAFAQTSNSGNVRINTTNSAHVTNTTTATASTGDNVAGGSMGGDGGNGGSATNAVGGGSNNNAANAGNGGSGGMGGIGGTVTTGDAMATAYTRNTLNGSDLRVTATSSPTDSQVSQSNRVTVNTNNSVCLDNTTSVTARTGGNRADGSVGGSAGNGGTASNTNNGDNNVANGGSAGDGGTGGAGGLVQTGMSTSTSRTINVLNSNIVRVTRM